MIKLYLMDNLITVSYTHLVATFALGGYKGTVEVYEYCNLHGLWKAEIEA